jgi:hypothetical protein
VTTFEHEEIVRVSATVTDPPQSHPPRQNPTSTLAPPFRYQTNKHNLMFAHLLQLTIPGMLQCHPYCRACPTHTYTGTDTAITTLAILRHLLGTPAPIVSSACMCAFAISVMCSQPVCPQHLHPGLGHVRNCNHIEAGAGADIIAM